MPENLTDENVTLLKAYFGKAFHKDIERYKDCTPRVLRVLKDENKDFRNFLAPLLVGTLIFSITVTAQLIQGESFRALLTSGDIIHFFIALFAGVIIGGALILIVYLSIDVYNKLSNYKLLYELMALMLENDEEAEDIRHFLLKGKRRNRLKFWKKEDLGAL